MEVNVKKGTVWMVGASSGLGLATARAFAEDGWLVISGARSFGSESLSVDNMMQLHLDVTDPASCQQFAEEALRAGGGRVDAVVYCAALLVLGACEETSSEEYNRVMQTNFIGMTRMVTLALPAMRSQNSGKIILFSSVNGLLGIPFQGAYTASKHAIEGYAECLGMEVGSFGIQVCLVEPGDHRGGSQRCRLHAADAKEQSPYAAAYKDACEVIARDENGGLLPEELGRKVVRNANRSRMRRRLRVAKADQRLAVVLHDLLPTSWNNWILGSYYRKKESA